ncbi:MAG: DUF2478 domain-containing protein [Roseinatronobacter sp.]
MLAYFIAEGRGAADRLLVDLARDLHARGLNLAGVIQINREKSADRHCNMDLVVLGHDHQVRISQDLGPLARGCRLDPQGLETAVGLVMADLGRKPDLLLVNKFGKSESEGRGFRPCIAEALVNDIPVLTAVTQGNRAAFLDFAGDIAQVLPANLPDLRDWALLPKQSMTEQTG